MLCIMKWIYAIKLMHMFTKRVTTKLLKFIKFNTNFSGRKNLENLRPHKFDD